MTDERLAEIEKQFLNTIVIDKTGSKLVMELAQALRAERAKVDELQNNIDKFLECQKIHTENGKIIIDHMAITYLKAVK